MSALECPYDQMTVLLAGLTLDKKLKAYETEHGDEKMTKDMEAIILEADESVESKHDEASLLVAIDRIITRVQEVFALTPQEAWALVARGVLDREAML